MEERACEDALGKNMKKGLLHEAINIKDMVFMHSIASISCIYFSSCDSPLLAVSIGKSLCKEIWKEIIFCGCIEIPFDV